MQGCTFVFTALQLVLHQAVIGHQGGGHHRLQQIMFNAGHHSIRGERQGAGGHLAVDQGASPQIGED